MTEMEFFIQAAEPFQGMEINVLSETIPTHEYESKTLTKAFEEITGIKVNHQLLGEGEVVQAVQTQIPSPATEAARGAARTSFLEGLGGRAASTRSSKPSGTRGPGRALRALMRSS